MSPTLKKVLLIGGVAVVGYVVYTKVMKAAPIAPIVELPVAPTPGRLTSAPYVPNVTVTTTEGNKRGVAGYLGSLGRSW